MIINLTTFSETAKNITNEITFTCTNINEKAITDNKIQTTSKGENITISGYSDVVLEGIYIKYNNFAPQSGLLDGTYSIAQNGFVHEYIDLNGRTGFTLTFPQADICEITVFSEGSLPEYVQLWEVGKTDTDILLCATHSDDDQLFFAGLLPYYAKYKGARVRVAYFINHYNTTDRTHELLDGLWECGVTYYPDISPFPDYYSESSAQAEKILKNCGFERQDLIDFQLSLIEKYNPLVAVLHDFNGEYGHGAHILNTETFLEACEISKNTGVTPEKIYVHLYDQNQIKLDIDTPLDVFDGKSSFNISQNAFSHHKSQHWTWFYKWIYGKSTPITNASQITSYNPAVYGLYYTSVGADTLKNDLLENIKCYDVREKGTRRNTVISNWRNNKDILKRHIDKIISENTTDTSGSILDTAIVIIILILIFKRKKVN